MAPITNALLLAAGLGTRLRPLTLVRAKPAIPIAGTPIARRIIRWLARAGISEVAVNLHYRPETIASVLGDGSDLGVRVRYSWEQPVVLGSAGGPRLALDIIGRDTFLIVNGDTLTDAALGPLVEAHAGSGALVTMAVTPNTRPQQYSGLRVAPDGAVLGVEPRGSSRPSFHFIGVQVANREAFVPLPPGRVANSVGDLYDALLTSRPGSIRAHLCDARFWDIGTVGDYWSTCHAVAPEPGTPETAEPSLGAGATLHDSIVWDGVAIGERASVTSCIVTDGVRVEAVASHSKMVLLRGADGTTVAVPFSPEK